KKPLTVVGRVVGLRGQGGLMFFDLHDGTSKLQALVKLGEIKPEASELFESSVDRGDILEVTGGLFLTKSQEKTLLVKSWRMLAKSVRPLPDKWHGLVDLEERFRRRYLDSLLGSEVRERFVLRSRLIRFLRQFLEAADYLEFETPILQTLAGGATAKPFQTYHEALGLNLYLRISPELYLKELLIGGFPKVFELSKCFRNEGIDATHHPEFTMLEFYEAYSDAAKQRQFVEQLIKNLVQQLTKSATINYDQQAISFRGRFKVISYYDLLKRDVLITDPATATDKELALKAAQFGVELPTGASREKTLDQIYKKVCRPKLIQPTFIVDYPKNYLPLAKTKTAQPALADAFQLVIGGLEIVKAFSELNDPAEQRERFLNEEKNRQAGETETQPFDESYLEALEYGLPPAGGVGIGIDRLVMLFTGATNIREVIYFPTLRPKDQK
ncbi:MAG: lysine--tRNA ligase, partial [Patescibacteria group bacterium]